MVEVIGLLAMFITGLMVIYFRNKTFLDINHYELTKGLLIDARVVGEKVFFHYSYSVDGVTIGGNSYSTPSKPISLAEFEALSITEFSPEKPRDIDVWFDTRNPARSIVKKPSLKIPFDGFILIFLSLSYLIIKVS